MLENNRMELEAACPLAQGIDRMREIELPWREAAKSGGYPKLLVWHA